LFNTKTRHHKSWSNKRELKLFNTKTRHHKSWSNKTELKLFNTKTCHHKSWSNKTELKLFNTKTRHHKSWSNKRELKGLSIQQHSSTKVLPEKSSKTGSLHRFEPEKFRKTSQTKSAKPRHTAPPSHAENITDLDLTCKKRITGNTNRRKGPQKNGSLHQSKSKTPPENCTFGWRGMPRDTSYAMPSAERHRAPLTYTKLH
jgi:hypothetical protein